MAARADPLVSPTRRELQRAERILGGLQSAEHSWRRRWDTGYRSFRQSLSEASALQRRLEDRGSSHRGNASLSAAILRRFRAASVRLVAISQLIEMGIPAIDLRDGFLSPLRGSDVGERRGGVKAIAFAAGGTLQPLRESAEFPCHEMQFRQRIIRLG